MTNTEDHEWAALTHGGLRVQVSEGSKEWYMFTVWKGEVLISLGHVAVAVAVAVAVELRPLRSERDGTVSSILKRTSASKLPGEAKPHRQVRKDAAAPMHAQGDLGEEWRREDEGQHTPG